MYMYLLVKQGTKRAKPKGTILEIADNTREKRKALRPLRIALRQLKITLRAPRIALRPSHY